MHALVDLSDPLELRRQGSLREGGYVRNACLVRVSVYSSIPDRVTLYSSHLCCSDIGENHADILRLMLGAQTSQSEVTSVQRCCGQVRKHRGGSCATC